MPRGNPAVKIAITVDPEVHAKVIRAARTKHVSVSAWMSDAARHALKIEDGLAAVAEWEAEHGVFTEEELAEAQQRLARKYAEAERRARARRRRK